MAEINSADIVAASGYAHDLVGLVFDLEPEDAWPDRYWKLNEHERLLVAVIVVKWDIDNGGLDQCLQNYTGFFTPEAIEGYRWLDMPLAADAIEVATRRLGDGDLRDQDFRRSATKQLWTEQARWDHELSTQYYSAFEGLSDSEAWDRILGEKAIRAGLYPRLRDARFDKLPAPTDPAPPPPKPW